MPAALSSLDRPLREISMSTGEHRAPVWHKLPAFYSLSCITTKLLLRTTNSLYSGLTGHSNAMGKGPLLLQRDSPFLWSCVPTAARPSGGSSPRYLWGIQGSRHPQMLSPQFLHSSNSQGMSQHNPAPSAVL